MIKKLLLFSLLLRICFIFGPYHPDLGNHVDWGRRFWEYGPRNFYTANVWSVSWPNQPPGTMYLWAGLSKINDLIFSTLWWFNIKVPVFPSGLIPFAQAHLHPALVKIPSVLAEIGIGYLIYLLVSKYFEKKKALLASALFLFNPMIIYNSSVWGQTDGLVNFFALLSLYLIFKRKFWLSIFVFFLSLYIKFSLIFFTPVLVIMILRERISLVRLFTYFLSSIIIYIFLSLPFSWGESPLWLINLYASRVVGGQGNMLTANAFNLWAMIFGIDFSRTDQGLFLGLTNKMWGLAAFLVLSGVVLYKFLVSKYSLSLLSMGLTLLSFISFLFLTNMHERYLYPTFPYLAILASLGLIPVLLYALISLIHFLNLYNLWFYPRINFLINLLEFKNAFFVHIFSLGLIIIFFYLFWVFWLQRKKIDTPA